MKKYPYKCKNDNRICDYGCGKPAKWIFKNGKACCSKNHASCSDIKPGPDKETDYPWSKKEFLNAWKSGNSITNVAKKVYDKDKINGGRKYLNTKKYAEKLELDIEEKKNQQKLFNTPGLRSSKKTKLKEILSGNCPNYRTNRLKKRLFESGKKQKNCEKCGIKKTVKNVE